MCESIRVCGLVSCDDVPSRPARVLEESLRILGNRSASSLLMGFRWVLWVASCGLGEESWWFRESIRVSCTE